MLVGFLENDDYKLSTFNLSESCTDFLQQLIMRKLIRIMLTGDSMLLYFCTIDSPFRNKQMENAGHFFINSLILAI